MGSGLTRSAESQYNFLHCIAELSCHITPFQNLVFTSRCSCVQAVLGRSVDAFALLES